MKQNNTIAALPADLQAALTHHQAMRETFEAARDEADRIETDMQKHRTAADVAETEAQQMRQEAATLMRSTTTAPQDLRDLKAKERAAYATAEDYRAIVAEFEQAHDDAKTKAGVARIEEDAAYQTVLETYADTLMSEAERQVAPLLRAIAVQERAYNSEAARGYDAAWEYMNESAADAALARMYGVIKEAFAEFKFDSASDAVLQATVRPSGLGRFPRVTPAALHYRKTVREMAARQRSRAA
ncbi:MULTISPECIES: hypothetical protein [Ralstonia solanacearum species complex]|uniref:Uncharacterized protein n=3 Tax=Ralstonia solanacearum TaxID=305 RepID=A0ABF7REG4_RALSL|nr:hypothetical protein [Ralstonia solanacearum]ALF87743.1 hypothetical protein RSUY_13800 [Ralstonia solanacearum]ATI27241.1 hypothetical protein CCY86_06890 [Ralstonia solanacearum]EAP74586.1 hypothetical protein RRSL_04440 [Ralstonia solanacearum UW551]KEI32039.1 hypothetical protein CQ06_19150 [Ralstonia solanacearum]KFX79905.1 hypothetical protein KR98_06060 [Ralstonia solanacearum]